ncbi:MULTISPECIES: metal-dependent hydrolase [unclassified Geodermatophilus]
MGGAQRDRWSRWAPATLLLGVLLLDAVQFARPWPVPVVGLLDEPAHLATAWLGLAALAPRHTPRAAWWAALVAAVAIDLDHVPLYLTDGAFAVDGGRPPTHSLLVVAVSTVLAGALRAWWLLGVAAGLVLHLLRDVATGPGAALLWPASEAAVRLPYPAYATALLGLGLLATARRRPAPIPAVPPA